MTPSDEAKVNLKKLFADLFTDAGLTWGDKADHVIDELVDHIQDIAYDEQGEMEDRISKIESAIKGFGNSF